MSKATVLVVEDHKDTLEFIQALLEQNGFTVIPSQNCSTAFSQLSQSRPDVILTDLMIPEMTGLEFIYRLRRVTNFDMIPIIAMSAFDRTYLMSAIGAGAEAMLHKPDDLSSLVDVINRVLAKRCKLDTTASKAKLPN
jgi:CheY-like chemotaxis protein